MAEILENKNGRRTIRLTCEDVISVVREYQCIACGRTIEEIRKNLQRRDFYLPEDV